MGANPPICRENKNYAHVTKYDHVHYGYSGVLRRDSEIARTISAPSAFMELNTAHETWHVNTTCTSVKDASELRAVPSNVKVQELEKTPHD